MKSSSIAKGLVGDVILNRVFADQAKNERPSDEVVRAYIIEWLVNDLTDAQLDKLPVNLDRRVINQFLCWLAVFFWNIGSL